MTATDPLADLRFARPEHEVAADAIWACFAAGLIPKTGQFVIKAARAAKLEVEDLRLAADRHAQRGVRAPTRRPEPTPPERPMAPVAPVPDEDIAAQAAGHRDAATHQRWAEGTARGQATAAANRTRQPKAGQTTMVCGACGNELAIARFKRRADRPGRRWTICDDCKRERGRDRYLSVEKAKAMNAARVTFVLTDGDERLTLACIDCGEEFKAGDQVEGTTQLAHIDCPERGLHR